MRLLGCHALLSLLLLALAPATVHSFSSSNSNMEVRRTQWARNELDVEQQLTPLCACGLGLLWPVLLLPFESE